MGDGVAVDVGVDVGDGVVVAVSVAEGDGVVVDVGVGVGSSVTFWKVNRQPPGCPPAACEQGSTRKPLIVGLPAASCTLYEMSGIIEKSP